MADGWGWLDLLFKREQSDGSHRPSDRREKDGMALGEET